MLDFLSEVFFRKNSTLKSNESTCSGFESPHEVSFLLFYAQKVFTVKAIPENHLFPENIWLSVHFFVSTAPTESYESTGTSSEYQLELSFPTFYTTSCHNFYR